MFVMPEIAIVRDERNVVIETDLGDERVGNLGFVSRADHACAKRPRTSSVTFGDLEERQAGEHGSGFLTRPIA